MVPYPQPDSPWSDGAEWHENGLPANLKAVLHGQWKRMKRRRSA